jgi:hypothetical protein
MKVLHLLLVSLLVTAVSAAHVGQALGIAAWAAPGTVGSSPSVVVAPSDHGGEDGDRCPPGEASPAHGGCCCPQVSPATLAQPTSVPTAQGWPAGKRPWLADQLPSTGIVEHDPPVPRTVV